MTTGTGLPAKVQRASWAAPVYLASPENELQIDSANALPVASGPGSVVQAVVAIGQSLSPAVDLGNSRLGRIGCPGAMDAATKLTFQTSHDNATWRDLYDQYGTEYTMTVAVNHAVVPDLTMFAAARYVKVRMGTAAVPVPATVARSFDLSLLA